MLGYILHSILFCKFDVPRSFDQPVNMRNKAGALNHVSESQHVAFLCTVSSEVHFGYFTEGVYQALSRSKKHNKAPGIRHDSCFHQFEDLVFTNF